MISREVLNAQRGLYVQGRERAAASVVAFDGAIECIDTLLGLLDQADAARESTTNDAALDAAKEIQDA